MTTRDHSKRKCLLCLFCNADLAALVRTGGQRNKKQLFTTASLLRGDNLLLPLLHIDCYYNPVSKHMAQKSPPRKFPDGRTGGIEVETNAYRQLTRAYLKAQGLGNFGAGKKKKLACPNEAGSKLCIILIHLWAMAGPRTPQPPEQVRITAYKQEQLLMGSSHLPP